MLVGFVRLVNFKQSCRTKTHEFLDHRKVGTTTPQSSIVVHQLKLVFIISTPFVQKKTREFLDDRQVGQDWGIIEGSQPDKVRHLNRATCFIYHGRSSFKIHQDVENQRKTKGQQLKGKIVSALFLTFWHFSTHFHTFSEFFKNFPPGPFLRINGVLLLFQIKETKREEKIIKRKRQNHFARWLLHVCPPL